MAERSSYSTDIKILRNALITLVFIVLAGYAGFMFMGSNQTDVESETQDGLAATASQTSDGMDGGESEATAEDGGTQTDSDSSGAGQTDTAQTPDEETPDTDTQGDDASGAGQDARPSAGARQTAIAQGTPMPAGRLPGAGEGAAQADARLTAIAQGTMLPEGRFPDAGSVAGIASPRLTAIAQGTFTFSEQTPDDGALAPTPERLTTPVASATMSDAASRTDSGLGIDAGSDIETLPPGSTLLAVTRGVGAQVYDRPDGEVVNELAAGSSVSALARSDDGLWTLVQGGDSAGWVPLSQLVLYGAESLPVLGELELAAELPTAQPTMLSTGQPTPDALTQPTATPAAASAQTPGGTIEPMIARVASIDNRLNVRAGPGTDYAIIERLLPREELFALSRSADSEWVQLALPQSAEGAGWVAAEYVDLSDTIEALPVTDQTEVSEPVLLFPTPTPIVSAQDSPAPDVADSARAQGAPLVLRTGPGAEYEVDKEIAAGLDYIILEDSEDGMWSRIAVLEPPGGVGWVTSESLRFDGASEETTGTDADGSGQGSPESVSPEPDSTADELIGEDEPDADDAVTDLLTQIAPNSIMADDIVADDIDEPVTATVISEDTLLNVRSGPATAYDIIEKIVPGTVLTALAQNVDGDWVQVMLPDASEKTGWVAAEFVDLDDRAATLAILNTADSIVGDDDMAVSEAPDTEEPDTQAPETGEPETDEPVTDEPETGDIDTDEPETDLSDTQETDSDAKASAQARTTPVPNFSSPIPRGIAPSGGEVILATVISEDAFLNVRSGPGTEYDILVKVVPGDEFGALAQTASGNWIQISLPDADEATGWVAAEFVELSASADLLDISPMQESTEAENGPDSDSIGSDADDPETLGPPKYLPVAGTRTVDHAALAAADLGGMLVFEDSNGGAIYAYNLDTGELWPITTGFDPSLSPDGKTVAFTRDGGESGLYLIDIDREAKQARNERLIYSGEQRLASPKWSPDGGRIVYSHGKDGDPCYAFGGGCISVDDWGSRPVPDGMSPITPVTYHLSVVDTNGNDHHDLATLNSARAPDWNEAGIVYQSEAGLQRTADTPSAENQAIINDYLKPYFHDPDWQPDGGRIVYQGKEGSHWEIFTVNPDGSGVTALTRPKTSLVKEQPSNVAPAWSPDGSAIVFLSNRTDSGEAGDWRLWVMDGDGGNQRPLSIEAPITYTFGIEQAISWER